MLFAAESSLIIVAVCGAIGLAIAIDSLRSLARRESQVDNDAEHQARREKDHHLGMDARMDASWTEDDQAVLEGINDPY